MRKAIVGCLGVLASVATILGLLLLLGVVHNPFASRFAGYYKIHNRSSNLVLEVNGSDPLHLSSGGTVDQWGDQNAPNEEWKIDDIGGGYVNIINRSSNLLLEVNGSDPRHNSNGGKVDQWQDQGAPNEEWTLVSEA